MNRYRMPGPALYSNFVPIVQSSGMGKSRMVDEAAKMIFTLPFNLRSGADKSPSGKFFPTLILPRALANCPVSAYPPPNTEVRDFLKTHMAEDMDDLEFRYLYFLKELFDRVNANLSTLGPRNSYEAFALAWYNEFTEERQKQIYGETVDVGIKYYLIVFQAFLNIP